MLSEKIKNLILNELINSKVYVNTFDEIHFDIIVIDDIFINVDLIERHRCIYNIIKNYILNKILHAVSIKTYTLDEWKEIFGNKI